MGELAGRPNILFFHVDNLGFGELSCYSGGPFRGASTDRIDAFAGEGFRLTNYCPESQCTPTRSALLTGRHAIRSGTHSVPIGSSGGWGLVAWEKTLGELLRDAGYACAAYGKWHVGEGRGRWPTDRGFEEWYGPPRTYDEALWPTDPWYDPDRDPVSRMLEIKRGEPDVTEGEQLTLDVRRDCDAEYLRRAETFIRRSVQGDAPFFLYFNHSLLHMPVIPRAEFKGRSGQGDWADSLLELDTDFGTLLDLLDELDVADDTLVVFAGDNGPEDVLLWRGSPGYWEGSYFAGGRGTCALRASFAGQGASRRGGRATRSCTSPTGSPQCCTRPGRASPPTASSTASISSTGSRADPTPRAARATSTGWALECTVPSGAISSSFSSPSGTCRTQPRSFPLPA